MQCLTIAAELAKNNNIKVYSIGIGTNGYALMPTQTDIFGDLVFTETEVKIDEPVLKEVAQMTGGKYFRATSNSVWRSMMRLINWKNLISRFPNCIITKNILKFFFGLHWEC
jgi:Ca-activated chloride channel family protein